MVWKDGKSGIHTGRTVRSTSRSHLQRREGLLVKSTANTFDEVNREEGEAVLYSLGKQNRWLLPEVIKTNSAENRDKVDDDVVLVERYTPDEGKKTPRPDCFSIYVSENGTTYRPRRNFAHAKNLLTDGERTKYRYEVAYPHPSGSYPHGRESRSKGSRAHLGQRKKNHKRNWALEDYLDGLEEEEVSDNEILEDGFNECGQSYIQVRSPLNVDLGLVIKHSSQKSSGNGSVAPISDVVESDKNCRDECKNGECIYVGTESEMYDAHLTLLAQIKHSSSFHDEDEPGDDNPTTISKKALKKAKRWRWRRKRRNRRSEHNRNYLAQQAAKQSSVHHDAVLDEPVTITLKIEDVSPAALEQQWGNIYREGSCFPRTFTLEAMHLIPHCTDRIEIYLLFQLVNNSLDYAVNHIKAFVSLVMSCDKITSERVLLEFLLQIGAREVDKEIWSIEDVMNVVISCFSSESIMGRLAIMNYAEPRRPRQSLDSLGEVVGWHSKSFSLKGAHKEVRKILTENTPRTAGKKENNSKAGNQNDDHSLGCGICFQEFTFEGNDTLPNYTVLMECDHMFCNKCWKAHLETQILHGQTVLRCPGHDCNAVIDDVTVMSLVPSLYGRHVEKRLDSIIEVSPEWKWCPGDRCKLVAKCHSRLWGLPSTNAQPIPVLCSCGSVWCFKCQEDAHWPATCKEAQVFRENNKAYRQLLRTDRKRLITGVEVKNCPSCHYPIEKFQGCNHMYCGLCSTNFCWVCLSSGIEWDHVCRTFIKQRKVELKPETKHIRTFEHVAVMSRINRSPSLVCNIYKKFDRLEKGLKNFEKLLLWREEWNHSGSVSNLLNGLSKSNATQYLREAFSFKFQALLALEGTAIMLSFSKDTSGQHILSSEFNRLLFIVERLDEMLQNFSKCCQKESQIKRLQHLVKCGQKCFLSICRKTRRIK